MLKLMMAGVCLFAAPRFIHLSQMKYFLFFCIQIEGTTHEQRTQSRSVAMCEYHMEQMSKTMEKLN